jgi:hypothetical protein
LPADGPKDYETGGGKARAAARVKKGGRADPRAKQRASSLAAILRRALDAPVAVADGERRRLGKRELMIRGLVERSAGGELAATKLLFEILRKTDPKALGPDPAETSPYGEDALAQLNQRLARLARAQISDASDLPQPADPPDQGDPSSPES